MRDFRASRLDGLDVRRDLPSLIGHWDCSTLTGSNGDAVGILRDWSGHGNDLTQDTTANKLTLATASLNGLNTASFGATSYLANSTFGAGGGFQPNGYAQPNTIIVVAKLASGVAADRVLVGGGSGSGRQNLLIKSATTGALQLYAGTSGVTGERDLGDDTWHILAGVFDTISGRFFIDGRLGAAPTTTQGQGSEAWNTIGLGATAGGSSPVQSGAVAELIACNARLSSGQIGDVTAALAAKWGLA